MTFKTTQQLCFNLIMIIIIILSKRMCLPCTIMVLREIKCCIIVTHLSCLVFNFCFILCFFFVVVLFFLPIFYLCIVFIIIVPQSFTRKRMNPDEGVQKAKK